MQRVAANVLAHRTQPFPSIDARVAPHEFNAAVFNGLKTAGGIVLTNLDSQFCASTLALLEAYNDFLTSPPELKASFVDTNRKAPAGGFYPYPNFIGNSKTCDRFFFESDIEGKVNQPLPTPNSGKMNMRDAIDQRNASTTLVLKRIAEALDVGFDLPKKPFGKFFGQTNITVLDAYLPITQEKLRAWGEVGQLQQTEDGRVEAFSPHKDYFALTLLSYFRNNCEGLEINVSKDPQRKQFQPLHLPASTTELCAVVMLGQMMETLTSGQLQAAEHRVVIEPMRKGVPFNRMAANTFFTHPITTKPFVGASPASPDTLSTGDQIARVSAQLAEELKERAIHGLPEVELKQFPKEEDIIKVENGYLRK